jgi:hypothetical protein
MRYFKLSDDVAIDGRWHIAEVTTNDGWEPDLSDGSRFGGGGLTGAVSHRGNPLDFCLTSFAVPIARTPVAQAIEAIAHGDVERIPVAIVGHLGFEVLNARRVIECLDEGRSEFAKWTKDDHRPELAGHYRMVVGLKVRSNEIPPDAHFFRVARWKVALIVSEHVKLAMERTGCRGARFVDVT